MDLCPPSAGCGRRDFRRILRRFGKGRKDKKVAHAEWASEAEAEITRIKDGATHLAYKAKPVVDLVSNIVMAAEIYSDAHADMHMLPQSVGATATGAGGPRPEVAARFEVGG